MPTALITGISGQDGAYLARHLLSLGYEVYGGQRRSSSNEHWRLKKLGILNQVKMVSLELLEFSNVVNCLKKVKPDEIYNLAAMSFVGASFEQPVYTGDTNGLGVVRLLEAMRQECPEAKFYQASTSEMFGSSSTTTNFVSGQNETYQDESTRFYPRSPYGCAKLYAHTMVVNYRESYGMHCSSGILFNHESPLRGQEFVTRKITTAVAKIHIGEQSVLELGNMTARRDWGHAHDYVVGMHTMLQQDKADDYVLATGETHSVEDFVNAAFNRVGGDLIWEGEGLDRVARLKPGGDIVVKVNPEFYRPADVEYLCGKPTKAETVLKWERRYSFDELVSNMVESDLELAKMGLI
jgi:GDPmannose 4,6-dehydratase